ncbi:MAG: transcription termination factor NusA [Flavobacteriales bacterium]|nr:transcription termination/antitermination protein NusA [Flavobacteriales bacterium]MCB0788081.1 transcription termination/antitermination protein NusA [Flavobacteriales bacterium]MCB0807658.1 transcription termination/antitermination protein NusA [Flavobacteriales bacterium]MCB0815986.1 transcription termination/antitermination protein NusA [Flavobacteriales bacterium]MCB9181882.1 transcription termination/antitermination protein NusA [Flavobacteriales bacterium]
MSTVNLVEHFLEFKDLKNIDRVTLMGILEDVFRSVAKKKYGEEASIDVIINPDKGDLEIFLNREIVPDGEVEDPSLQVSLSEARQVEPDFEVGEELSQEVKLDDFGRRNVLTLRQNLQGRILEMEKDHLYNKYKERVGEIITGEVYQIWKRETLVLDDEGNELILPKDQQIRSDFFKKGDTVRAVVWKVEMRNNTPVVILSRTAPEFLEKLFEQEVPEVYDGLITIKRIVREPGERAKVAVESYDDRIDPVGACVGMKGSRIHGIVRELRNENIDVINYTANDQLLIQRALSPAKIGEIKLNEESRRAEVYLKPDQVALAIGKGGHNIKLAGKLTGYEIDVYRETDEVTDDVDLTEFSDEIDQWIIDILKGIGCDTARSVIDIPMEDLVKRTDLEVETVKEVLRILREELEA